MIPRFVLPRAPNSDRAVGKLLRPQVPYTAVIFILGVAWGALQSAGELSAAVNETGTIDPGLLLLLFLPPIVFFSSFETSWYMFRRSITQIILLAVVGTALCAFFGAVVVKFVLEDWSWSQSLLLGSVLSATDPVAVVALMQSNAAPVQVNT